jgi:hypothetical protein
MGGGTYVQRAWVSRAREGRRLFVDQAASQAPDFRTIGVVDVTM